MPLICTTFSRDYTRPFREEETISKPLLQSSGISAQIEVLLATRPTEPVSGLDKIFLSNRLEVGPVAFRVVGVVEALAAGWEETET